MGSVWILRGCTEDDGLEGTDTSNYSNLGYQIRSNSRSQTSSRADVICID